MSFLRILTPSERRLATLLFILTLLGSLARLGKRTNPEIEAWLAGAPDSVPAEGAVSVPERGLDVRPDIAPDAAPDAARHSVPGAPLGSRARPPMGAESSPASPDGSVDPNRAGFEALLSLPGVGPVLARRIVSDRARNGPYRSAEDLLRVPGIGPATLERIRPRLDFDDDGEPPG
jgi:competence protein ComEA